MMRILKLVASTPEMLAEQQSTIKGNFFVSIYKLLIFLMMT